MCVLRIVFKVMFLKVCKRSSLEPNWSSWMKNIGGSLSTMFCSTFFSKSLVNSATDQRSKHFSSPSFWKRKKPISRNYSAAIASKCLQKQAENRQWFPRWFSYKPSILIFKWSVQYFYPGSMVNGFCRFNDTIWDMRVHNVSFSLFCVCNW